MIKKELIRAAKVGKQYRILGKEILRVISPVLEDKVGKTYGKVRRSRPGLFFFFMLLFCLPDLPGITSKALKSERRLCGGYANAGY
ncbi:MAG: hypothetical protein A3C35_02440 [Omnitrophica bacterium RIFCSPHIGHO2_02_FULL_46_11]|nr:MAG: hypothetical protein A3C35_02440 [Omnitrophica bacterium RIFCSPHIGHO2_02_FULL_46_11]